LLCEWEVPVEIVGIWAYHKGDVFELCGMILVTLCKGNVLRSIYQKIKHMRVTLKEKLIESFFQQKKKLIESFISLQRHFVIMLVY